ncbi:MULTISPECIES: GLPGLI family protein [Empedobacter]|uniref:GLPGLI family protein n=1 Tax=Empedobacter TaxID=59734 RepID=UPI001C8E2FC9|nr:MULTISPECIES: GLPGLI family protein [Empedobacter]MBY0065467.1 GLPGLI family protein [Empedobacter falsenii]MDM1137894.1 GLPGLI family protein [Empedobacter sp. R132-2]
MKKILTIFTLCSFLTTSFAQKLEVNYQETTDINVDELKKNMKVETSGSVNLPKDFYDNMFKSMSEPKDYTLTIYDNTSTYKKVEKLSNGQGGGGFSISVSFSGGGNGILKDLSTKEYSKSVNLMDKSYLIKDKLTEYKWQLTRETKKIIGFDVKKATAVIDSTKSVVAWYTPSIAVKDGPSMYNGLPGLILEMEIINTSKSDKKSFGNVTIKATEVKEVPDMKPIEKPKEKNVITEKEFKELSDKQMERFKSMRSETIDKKD